MSGRGRNGGNRGPSVPGALLVGLDGVLRVRDEAATAELEHAYGVEPGTLDGVALAPERLLPALTGQVSDTEWRLSVAAALVDELGSVERAADLVSRWAEPTGYVDDAVHDLVGQVRRRGVPVVIVANATTRLDTDLALLGLRSGVDGVVSSARVGSVLPDESLYREAARVAEVTVPDCLFVDTVAEHVAAARALGMAGHRFEGLDGLRAALAPLLALPESGERNGHSGQSRRGRAEGGSGRRVV